MRYFLSHRTEERSFTLCCQTMPSAQASLSRQVRDKEIRLEGTAI